MSIDEIVDDFDLQPFAAEGATGLVAQVVGHCRDPIRFLDREFCNRIKRRILPDDGDVRSVQRRDQMDVFAGFAQHLAGNPGAGRMRNRVVAMEQLESVGSDDLVHPHRQSEIVGWKLEQRVAAHVDFVKEDARQKRRKAKRLPIGDEMDFVPAIRQCDA